MADADTPTAAQLAELEREVRARTEQAEQRRRELVAHEASLRVAVEVLETARRRSEGVISQNGRTPRPSQEALLPKPSKIEGWARSGWFKLLVVAVVAGILVTIVAVAYETIEPLPNTMNKVCDSTAAATLKSDIENLPDNPKVNITRRIGTPMCAPLGQTMTITIPINATVNITATSPQFLARIRFNVCPSAKLYLTNITMTQANYTTTRLDDGGGSVCVGCYTSSNGRCAAPSANSPSPPPPPSPKPGGKRAVGPADTTVFECVDCTFSASSVVYHTLATATVPRRGNGGGAAAGGGGGGSGRAGAHGGAVLVDGNRPHPHTKQPVPARVSFVRCAFDSNLALVFASKSPKAAASPALPVAAGKGNASVGALGGALYISGATLTLVEPRFSAASNHAQCWSAPAPPSPGPPPPPSPSGCLHDGDDVYIDPDPALEPSTHILTCEDPGVAALSGCGSHGRKCVDLNKGCHYNSVVTVALPTAMTKAICGTHCSAKPSSLDDDDSRGDDRQ